MNMTRKSEFHTILFDHYIRPTSRVFLRKGHFGPPCPLCGDERLEPSDTQEIHSLSNK